MNKNEATKRMNMTVQWSDCDPAGISYFARNFEWYTNGYVDWLAKSGLPYMESFHHAGVEIVCLKADSEYKKMIQPFEEIAVLTTLSSLTKTRLQFTYEVIKENGELAGKGFTNHTFVNQKGRPVNLQKQLPDVWETLSGIYVTEAESTSR